jgi:hypothetical protein
LLRYKPQHVFRARDETGVPFVEEVVLDVRDGEIRPERPVVSCRLLRDTEPVEIVEVVELRDIEFSIGPEIIRVGQVGRAADRLADGILIEVQPLRGFEKCRRAPFRYLTRSMIAHLKSSDVIRNKI